MLTDFCQRRLPAHRSGLLAYYDYFISTGPLEGTNTKIKLLQRQAYGFRDMDFFKLKIMGTSRVQDRFSRMSHQIQKHPLQRLCRARQPASRQRPPWGFQCPFPERGYRLQARHL